MRKPIAAAASKAARSVEVLLSAIQAAVKSSLSSSTTAPNTAPLALPSRAGRFDNLAQFRHGECSILSVVAAGPPLCLLWGHFLPKAR